jgi:sortase A
MDAAPEAVPRLLLPSSRSSLAAGLERLLWLVAAGSLGLVLWMMGDAYLFQLRAGDLLPGAGERSRVEDSSRRPRPAARQPILVGTPVARLAIPHLDYSVIVAEGATSKVLRRAVGHLPASARPGESGNVVLAGHRDTFFRRLEHVERGDRIVLESEAGAETYRIEWTAVVEPQDVEVMADTGYPALTLITCYPFRYVGNAPQRFVVRARRLGPLAEVARALTSRR